MSDGLFLVRTIYCQGASIGISRTLELPDGPFRQWDCHAVTFALYTGLGSRIHMETLIKLQMYMELSQGNQRVIPLANVSFEQN